MRAGIAAKRRVIEKNGGVPHSEPISREMGELLRKYWIVL
jgi:predicted acetyltransferase